MRNIAHRNVRPTGVATASVISLCLAAACSSTPDSPAPLDPKLLQFPLQTTASSTTNASSMVSPLSQIQPGQVVSMIFSGGHIVSSSVSTLPSSAYVTTVEPPSADDFVPVGPPPRKIESPLEDDVQRLEAGAYADHTVQVIVTFAENLRIPRRPNLARNEPRTSAANQAALQQTHQLVASVEALRAPAHAAHAKELATNNRATLRETFWLINALSIDLPLSQVRAVAARGDVQAIEYRQKAVPPPSGFLSDARALMHSDPLAARATSGFIGLVDTGVRSTHVLLSNPSHLGFLADCVNGTSNDCFTGSNLDPSDSADHGTGSMSELTGNANLGDPDRGVTAITVDSWKVYVGATFVTAAVIRGLQAAFDQLDDTAVVEIQDPSGGNLGAIAAAADAAYDGGMVVVSVAGNYGPNAGSCTSPGNAKKVLAVGAVDVTTQALNGFSGRGPMSDGRVKPDLVGPTNVWAASAVSDTALLSFGFTSGATANVGGAVDLMYDAINSNSGNFIDPGIAYSWMIMSGGNPNGFDNNVGAGLPNLTWIQSGNAVGGIYSVTTNLNINITYTVNNPNTNIDIGMWWPEPETTHSTVRLYLYQPNGVRAAQSRAAGSVFQKIHIPSPLQTGTWTITIHGATVVGTQNVYLILFNR